jgi:gluconate 2-dehydrogenase alpha chain
MGSDPRTAVVNRYGQRCDVPNLFIVGSSTFPSNSGFHPTLTIQALVYTTADAIVTLYKNRPGPLV